MLPRDKIPPVYFLYGASRHLPPLRRRDRYVFGDRQQQLLAFGQLAVADGLSVFRIGYFSVLRP